MDATPSLNNFKPVFNFKATGIDNQLAHAELTNLLNQPYQVSGQITATQLMATAVDQMPCLLEPFLQKCGLACLAGSSDTGKSSLLRQLAIAVAAGDDDFLGFKLNPTHRSVIYVSTEDDPQATGYLLRRQTATYHSNQLHNLRFVFDATNLQTVLDNYLSTQAADLVIVDCFADAFGGDLKDTQRLRTYLHPYHQLAQKHNCLFLFLHHTGKRTEGLEPSKNNLLSGQGFEAKMRLVIELRADASNPHHRHLCIVKGNYLSALHKRESYVLHFDETTFTFTNTGERTAFELLAKRDTEDSGKAKYLQVKELIAEGHTYTAIAEMIGYSSKSSVADLMRKAKKMGWADNTENPNEENALT